MLKNFLNESNTKLNIKDYIALGIILIAYSVISFINLGSTINPNTFLRVEKTDNIIIELKNQEDIIKMKIFNGECNAKYQLYSSTDGKKYTYINDYVGTGALSWQEERIISKGKYIKILFLEKSSIGEIAFYNNNKEIIKIEDVIYNKQHIKSLNDEQNTIPNKISYMNSSYFDEIYFARTAYEYTQGMETYEWTHPPLGKLIQAIPIYINNYLSPFNYRLMGNISGILMIAVMYIFAKELFKKRKYAIFASLLMAFDTFHFAQTRMGTVDSHLILFILLASYFMVKYTKNNKTFSLLLSGIFFGLSVSVKWTGLYGGIALAIIFFTHLVKNKKLNIKNLLKGTLFFVVIPLFIYSSLYLIFPNNKLNHTTNFENIINQQKDMYNYHSKLNATHYFSSKWYTWPISYKPVWYHQEILNNDTKETISGIGNIVIWWMGIIGFLYSLIKLIKKKDKQSFIIVISMLSLWLPYAFIGRVMFLYHYFPVLPFMMLGIVNLFKSIEEKYKLKYLIPLYMIFVIAFFIIYYPVISGIETPVSYIEKLRIFDSWTF